jgi:dipeptidyl aminopeptidase/acylaminoacyl peptidase
MRTSSSALFAALLLGVVPVSAFGAEATPAAKKAFTVRDLVMMERVSDPRISPDGRFVVYQVRKTDLDSNKGVNGLWLLDLKTPGVTPRMLSAPGSDGNSPRWSPDSKAIYFLSSRSGTPQVWRLPLDGGEAQPVTQLPVEVGSFMLSPDGRRLAVTLDVFPDLPTLAETKKRLDEKAKPKASGLLFDKLFVRHWDTWSNGARAQLYSLALDAAGMATGDPILVSRGIDGDVPSKPFGDDTEYGFSPDGKTLYFNARIAGKTEAWSTNFDIFSAPSDGSAAPRNLTADNPAWDGYPLASPDGKKMYYLAMKRAGFEADRFGIMEMDLATGKKREVAPDWDRSAAAMKISSDGKTLYTNADDLGQNRLFAIDVATGKAKALTDQGFVSGYSVAGDIIVVAQSNLKSPAELFRLAAAGGKAVQLTQQNAAAMAGIAWADFEQFSFKGAKDETVYGYVMKPANYAPGKKYPVAFLIHGGPQGSFGNEFHYRWNPQSYAGAGYAVVFIDFHGSTGYGQKFTDAVSGDWGGAPLEDLKKGWAYALQKYDFLDANRAAALGASYGGYMIAWIAGNWAEPWKCLVCHDGVFDTRLGTYSTDELWFDEWETGGTQWEKPEAYEKFNPLNHVSKWKVPMLVVQGALDYRVGSEHAIGIFSALQRRGIPSQLLYFPDENHWVLKPQNSIQWHETVLAWLNRWTAPATAK